MSKGKRKHEVDKGGRRKKRHKAKRGKSSGLAPNSNDNPPRCSLLGLPAELRNEIYRLASQSRENYEVLPGVFVSTQEQITVSAEFKESSLLQCCRQLREEAQPVFFKENEFRIVILICKLEPALAHWFWLDGIPDHSRELDCETRGSIRWRNIMKWLKLYHEDKVPSMPTHEMKDHGPELCAYSEAFAFVGLLRADPWKTVKHALKIFKRGINAATLMEGPISDDWESDDETLSMLIDEGMLASERISWLERRPRGPDGENFSTAGCEEVAD